MTARCCTVCLEPVLNDQPARVTEEGTRHLGGCPSPGDDKARERMIRAFRTVNSTRVFAARLAEGKKA